MTRDDPVDALIGQAAGSISRAVDNPSAGSLIERVIEAAYTIAYDEDRFMSAWTLASVLADGSTWWASPDGERHCYVSALGDVSFE